MKHLNINPMRIALALVFVFALASCGTTRRADRNVDYGLLARSGIRLGFDIDEDDNWPLMIEAASWIGTPYRYGGNDKSGVDCSGLTKRIYSNVYGVNLHRNSHEQYSKDIKRVSRDDLSSGDLVFFSTGKKGKVSHVGVYLKGGKFIHSSSSRGVVVDDLNQSYYRKNFISGGNVK